MKLLLSQEALSKEIGVSFATINRWENGENEPQLIQQAKFNSFCEKHDIVFDDNKK